MVADVAIVLDERDLGFEISGQVVVVEQDAVLQGLMPALDLSLGLGMIRSHARAQWPLGQIVCDVTRSIVAQEVEAAA